MRGENPVRPLPSRLVKTSKFCTFAHFVAVENADEICESDPQWSSAWEDSGAADLLNDYIVEHGNGTRCL